MNHDPSATPNQPDRRNESRGPTEPTCVNSTELLRGRREIQIEHAGDIYRLRITKAGKLILTK